MEADEKPETIEANIIRKKVIPISPLTEENEAIDLVVMQRINSDGQRMAPSVVRRGKMPKIITKRLAHDLGVGYLIASFFMDEWEDR